MSLLHVCFRLFLFGVPHASRRSVHLSFAMSVSATVVDGEKRGEFRSQLYLFCLSRVLLTLAESCLFLPCVFIASTNSSFSYLLRIQK